MKELKLPRDINVSKYCSQGEHLSGQLFETDLPRLKSMEARYVKPASVALDFQYDESGLKSATGTLTICVELMCQRCLNPFLNELSSRIAWGIVSSDKDAKHLPEMYEPIICSKSNHINLIEQLEDEILLALPIVPMHDDNASCQLQKTRVPSSFDSGQKPQNPFSSLNQLKNKKPAK